MHRVYGRVPLPVAVCSMQVICYMLTSGFEHLPVPLPCDSIVVAVVIGACPVMVVVVVLVPFAVRLAPSFANVSVMSVTDWKVTVAVPPWHESCTRTPFGASVTIGGSHRSPPWGRSNRSSLLFAQTLRLEVAVRPPGMVTVECTCHCPGWNLNDGSCARRVVMNERLRNASGKATFENLIPRDASTARSRRARRIERVQQRPRLRQHRLRLRRT